ncbi:MetS family NSS transporter small subunit [Sporosalibacterium faouarense]|nr:MetS family NSS transporter small subunit [Sporosalibacterium faouarense]MTI47453.1 MetS family NSS transporter small subunit [Bacillota bacterium]
MSLGAWIMLIFGIVILYGGLFWAVSNARKSTNK